ncbi:MAG: GumC family protein [Blastocatellia bacterium]
MSSYRPRPISEYLRILFSRKLLLLLAIGSMLVATVAVIRHIPDSYESNASIVVTDNGEGRDLIAGRVAAAVERLSSRAFLEPIINENHLYGNTANSNMDAAVARMNKDIKVDAKYRGDTPEMVSFSYRNSDPTTAKNVATELVSVFSKMNNAIENQIAEAQASTAQEMGQIEGRLHQLGIEKASDESRKAASSRAQSEMNLARAQKVAAASSVEELTNKQYTLDQQIAEQKKEIAQQEIIAKNAPPPKVEGSSSYGALLVKKAELEGQIKLYSGQYTDKNPKMVETKTQLAALEKEIAKVETSGANTPDAGSAEARELRSMQRELAKMQIELDVTNRELAGRKQALGNGVVRAASTSDGIAAASAGENADGEGLKTRYTALLNRQDALQREKVEQAGLDPGVFQIVDPPALPKSPSGPNRAKLVLVALGISFAFGLIAVALLEVPRLSSVNSIPDVEYYLDTPVIALIPETLTPEETGRMRRLRLLRSVASVLVAAGLVPLFMLAFNYLQVFQILANH